MELPKDYLKKGYHLTIDETFKAYDNDTRIAVLLEDDECELIDWNFFPTMEEAKEYIVDEYNKQGAKLPEVF